MTSLPEMTGFLYAALEAASKPGQYGIVLSVSNIAAARTKVSLARKEAADPALDALECRPSPLSPSELWIIKRGSISAAEVAEAESNDLLSSLGVLDAEETE